MKRSRSPSAGKTGRNLVTVTTTFGSPLVSEGLQPLAHETLEPTGFQPVGFQFLGLHHARDWLAEAYAVFDPHCAI